MNRNGDTTYWANGNWQAYWDRNRCRYMVYYKKKLFDVVYKFNDVEFYLK